MRNEFPVYDICEFSLNQQDDIIVSRFAIYLKNLKKLHFPHRHDFYHLILFTHGGGGFSIDFQNFNITPYQIYFMAPGQVHAWNFEGDMDGYVVNFSSKFFKSFLLKSDYLDQFLFFSGKVQESVISIPEDSRESITRLLEECVIEAEGDNHFKMDSIRVLILRLFMLVGNLTEKRGDQVPNSYNITFLRSYEKLIDMNYLDLRLPKEYAALLYVTPNHLNALCNDVLGISAGEVIRNRIALEAKRMLINFSLTVKQIAYQLNFEDNSYFCKFFKKQTGLTPEAFRKQFNSANAAF